MHRENYYLFFFCIVVTPPCLVIVTRDEESSHITFTIPIIIKKKNVTKPQVFFAINLLLHNQCTAESDIITPKIKNKFYLLPHGNLKEFQKKIAKSPDLELGLT